MSYAEVASHGPKQSPEEARAPPVPSLSASESQASTSSLVDVDSPHVNSVSSDFREQAVKTETQAERIAQESERKAEIEKVHAEQKAEELKKKAATKGKEAKHSIKEQGRHLDANKENPVFVGNAILWSVTAVAVAVGAYQKHSEGKLDLDLAGKVALGLGALGAADYFASKWLVANKYPTDTTHKQF